ncbi:Acetyltransferase TRI7-like protein [Elsinoe fawcettii]|nr:Acetyltransferase TRI7-like protein [Elsinoe fawcettii]
MLCGQDPKLWPPVFGNITDAYTVRRYWSHFWHYLMRKSFTLPAATICKKVGLPEKSNLTRFVIVVLAFYFSAVMHILSASPYERCISGPELRYYTSAVVVITVEEILIAMGKKVKRMIKPRKTRTSITDTKSTEPYPVRRVEKEAPHIMLRVLGFIWVLSFHVWMTSNLIYGSWKKCIHR